MNNDITLDVLGNTSPFSMMGESSGYMITVNNHLYLLECGSPVFPILGYKGIADIRGIFATHSHEDHKRWFTDIVLFTFYNPLFKHKLKLISSELVLDEFAKNSKAALERSLSFDSKKVVDIPYGIMVEDVTIGPRAKYSIKLLSGENDTFYYRVEDNEGNPVGPEKAKIFINPAANRPRLLFKDEEYDEWVEPESFYPFSSTAFYEKDHNFFYDEEAGLTVKAIKSSVWHGVPSVAFKFITEKNSLLFSADTVYKPSLWKELCEEHHPQKFEEMIREEFEESSTVYADINNFIERTWSRERYDTAMSTYEGSVIVHDIARKNSVVHTDYIDIHDAPIENLIFTHNPDNLTALKPILTSGKKMVCRNGDVFESVNGELFPCDADVYINHFASKLVGYRSEKGLFKVIQKDGLLGVIRADGSDGPIEFDKELMRVELYKDIEGEYFPILPDPNKIYQKRADGRIEEITYNESGSTGRIVKNLRGKIKKGT